MKKNNKLLKILYVTLTISLVLVWGQSCISKTESRETSDIVVEWITPIDELDPGYSSETGWTYVELSTLVRKLAHVAEYSAVGFQVMAILLLKKKKSIYMFFNAFFLCMMISFVDETIQLFSNRGSLVSDIWIDIAGSVLGMIMAYVLEIIILAVKKKKQTT